MTERVYYENDQMTCRAEVRDCRRCEDGYEVLLSRTVFFPESGGQLSDTGTVGEAVMLHAREEGGEVWHLTDRAVELHSIQTLRADPAVRGDHSRQHTGEHILSGLAAKLFQAHNVGFHMGADYATLDLDRALTEAEARSLAEEANRAVMADLPVHIKVVDADELSCMTLRKKTEGLSGRVRIVYIGEVDSCTCCGTHCRTTGEVGYIRLDSVMKYKGGVRISFTCGERALRAALAQQAALDQLARRFSVKAEEAAEAVVRQGDELNKARRELKRRTEEWLGLLSEKLTEKSIAAGSSALMLYAAPGLTVPELKTLAEKLTQRENAVAVLLSENGENLYYCLMRGKGASYSMKELCAAVNAMTDGKGGGREEAAQGSARVRPGFAEMLEQLRGYLVTVLSRQG